MQLKKRLSAAILIFAILILAGGYAYHRVEGWNYLDSVYFTTITVTTVGYGDFAPETDIGKAFTIVFAISGISIVLYMLSVVGRSIFNFEFKNKDAARRGVIKVKKLK